MYFKMNIISLLFTVVFISVIKGMPQLEIPETIYEVPQNRVNGTVSVDNNTDFEDNTIAPTATESVLSTEFGENIDVSSSVKNITSDSISKLDSKDDLPNKLMTGSDSIKPTSNTMITNTTDNKTISDIINEDIDEDTSIKNITFESISMLDSKDNLQNKTFGLSEKHKSMIGRTTIKPTVNTDVDEGITFSHSIVISQKHKSMITNTTSNKTISAIISEDIVEDLSIKNITSESISKLDTKDIHNENFTLSEVRDKFEMEKGNASNLKESEQVKFENISQTQSAKLVSSSSNYMAGAGEPEMSSAGGPGIASSSGIGMPTGGVRGMTTGGVRGMPTAGVQGKPTTGVQRMSTVGVQGKPTVGSQGLNTVGVQGIPTAGVHGMPTAGVRGKPTAVVHGVPTTGEQGMPSVGGAGIPSVLYDVTSTNQNGTTQQNVTAIQNGTTPQDGITQQNDTTHLKGTSPQSGICDGRFARGTASGRCDFPFNYGGGKYCSCIPIYFLYVNTGYSWCPTNKAEGRTQTWDYCTHTVTKKGRKCIFPFTFNAVMYIDCAPGTTQENHWCATSLKDDGMHVRTWEICAPAAL